jgi:pimeloyl-ACP methyl ester carboxylesterase
MPDRPQFESDCTGHPGCVQSVEVRTGETRGAVDFPVVASAHVHGLIWDDKNDDGRRQAGEDGVRGLRVFLDDDNDAQLDPGELETRSLADGRYRLQIPTRYQLAGGALPPLMLERTTGVACSGPLDCTVYGLRTRSTEDTPAAHGVSRAAVIFVHGLGGSRIACGPGRMDLMDLRLGADGRGLRVSDGGTVCSQNAMDDGLVDQDASRHFEAITWPGRHYDYVWDWRRSPEDAVDGLDALVARVRAETGVAKVQLVGHASGGLVIRHYIADDARARKIQRAVTVGTPYWGAPKAILPLVAGDQDVMAATRTFPGHFALLPAFGYGSWLTVNGGRQLDLEGVEEYLRRIGVHPSLFVRAVSEHGRVLDHYEDHGVDFHVIAGGGLPTIAAVALRGGPISDEAALSWASGDETVPAVAAMHDTPRDNLHRVCGVANAALMTAPQTTALIDAFIVRGEPIRDAHQSCPWSARELALYDPAAPATAAAVSEPRVIAGGRSLPLADAERAGLVQVVTFGASTRVVARVGTDVRVELPPAARPPCATSPRRARACSDALAR